MKNNNELWRHVSNFGRPKAYATPELLWQAAVKYFEYMDNNPDYRSEWKDGKLRQIPVKRPYTIAGLQIFIGVNDAYIRQQRRYEKAYSTVIELIEKICREQKFAGAANGFFNANIISRDLGLVDKVETENTHKVNLSRDEIKEISKKLKEDI